LISNENGKVIVPRVCISKDEQRRRVQEKGEVFTPAWVCNAMNNLVDNAWFERKNAGFNKGKTKGWKATLKPISFPKNLKKTWQEYVSEVRLEITCGEAPYLVSRYDMAASADYKGLIPVDERIGLLDRKLRIVTENCRDIITWIDWAKKAVQSVLGYDWQGDNVFIARENVLWPVLETVHHEFNGATLSPKAIKEFAEIISWNIWQMDGLKFVIPCTCHSTPTVREAPKARQGDLFAVKEEINCGAGTSDGKMHPSPFDIALADPDTLAEPDDSAGTDTAEDIFAFFPHRIFRRSGGFHRVINSSASCRPLIVAADILIAARIV
jgi:hypothetical protein